MTTTKTPQDANEATIGAVASTAGLGAIDEETARLYAGKCCFCKFFRDAYIRTDEHPWVDNPGWCVRYPPVFVGGEEDKGEEVDYSRFKQPGVVGGDECGEFLQAEAPNVELRDAAEPRPA